MDKEAVKRLLTFDDISRHYNIQMPKKSDGNIKCPFPGEEEKRPSFTVNFEKRLWHDKRTGEGGDCISFVAKMEHLDQKRDFKELIKKCADIGRIVLKGDENIVEYYEERKNIHLEKLISSEELSISKEKFSIPIYDHEGKRCKEQNIFTYQKKLSPRAKSAMFYQESDIDFNEDVIVVEGVSDYLTMKSIGFKNVVGGVSATSTKELILFLKNFGARILISFDNDEAGRNAYRKIKTEFTYSVTSYIPDEEGSDLNDLLVSKGAKFIQSFFAGDGTAFLFTKPVGIHAVALEFVKKNPIGYFGKNQWIYRNGVWHTSEKREVDAMMIDFLLNDAMISYTKKIVDEMRFFVESFAFETGRKLMQKFNETSGVNKNCIYLTDGVYNVMTSAFRQYKPEDYVFKTLNFSHKDIQSKEECPQWDLFMDSVNEKYPDKKERILFIEEWLGYCLYPFLPFQNFLIIIGEGGNGKGVLFSQAMKLLGKSNYINRDINDFDQSDFNKHDIFQKYANIVTEARESTNIASPFMKSMTGDDVVTARALYKTAISFHPYAKLLMSYNSPPSGIKVEDWLTRRIQVLDFSKPFTRKKDPFLKDKLDKEGMGIAIRAIKGLKRLLKNSSFTLPPDSMIAFTKDFLASNDIVHLFYNQFLKDEAFLKTDDVYQDFKTYCEKSGYSGKYTPTMRTFLHRVEKFFKADGYLMDENKFYPKSGVKEKITF